MEAAVPIPSPTRSGYTSRDDSPSSGQTSEPLEGTHAPQTINELVTVCTTKP
jgi:hypothetical protein